MPMDATDASGHTDHATKLNDSTMMVGQEPNDHSSDRGGVAAVAAAGAMHKEETPAPPSNCESIEPLKATDAKVSVVGDTAASKGLGVIRPSVPAEGASAQIGTVHPAANGVSAFTSVGNKAAPNADNPAAAVDVNVDVERSSRRGHNDGITASSAAGAPPDADHPSTDNGRSRIAATVARIHAVQQRATSDVTGETIAEALHTANGSSYHKVRSNPARSIFPRESASSGNLESPRSPTKPVVHAVKKPTVVVVDRLPPSTTIVPTATAIPAMAYHAHAHAMQDHASPTVTVTDNVDPSAYEALHALKTPPGSPMKMVGALSPLFSKTLLSPLAIGSTMEMDFGQAKHVRTQAKKPTARVQNSSNRSASKSKGGSGAGQRKTAGKGHDRSADRIMRSNFFNEINIGDTVQVVRNQRAGHHDVTNRNPNLAGNTGKVVAVPVYPSTWLTVQLDSTSQVIKVRTSQIQKVEKGVPVAKNFSNDPVPIKRKKRGSHKKDNAKLKSGAGKGKTAGSKRATKSNAKQRKRHQAPPAHVPAYAYPMHGLPHSPLAKGHPVMKLGGPISPSMDPLAGARFMGARAGSLPHSPRIMSVLQGPISPFHDAEAAKDTPPGYLDAFYGREDGKGQPQASSDAAAAYKYMHVPLSADGTFFYQNVSPEAMVFPQSSYPAVADGARDGEHPQSQNHLSPMALSAGFMMMPQTPTSTAQSSEMYYYPASTTQANGRAYQGTDQAYTQDGNQTQFPYSPSPDRPGRSASDVSAMETLSNVAALTPRQRVQPDAKS